MLRNLFRFYNFTSRFRNCVKAGKHLETDQKKVAEHLGRDQRKAGEHLEYLETDQCSQCLLRDQTGGVCQVFCLFVVS